MNNPATDQWVSRRIAPLRYNCCPNRRSHAFVQNNLVGGLIMKTCTLNDFLEELNPWLDKDYIKEVEVNDKGHFHHVF